MRHPSATSKCPWHLTRLATLVLMACLAGPLALGGTSRALAIDPPDSNVTPEPGNAALGRLEQANQAYKERQYEQAGRIIEEVLAMPEFSGLTPEVQYRAVWIAALSAMKRHDPLEAHDYLVALTSFDFADVRAWKYRAQTAEQIEDWPDTLLALTMVATRWPAKLGGSAYDDWSITNAVYKAGEDSNLRNQRLDFMNALFSGGYTQQYGRQPGELWLVLAAEALERHDMTRAREVSQRIASSSALVKLRIDRRFDDLVAAEPSLRDVRGAAMRETKRLAAQVASHPRNLEPIAYYCDSLYTLGDFKTMLKVASSAIDKVSQASKDSPPYDDVDAQLGWIYNLQSMALGGLGRTEESTRVMADWNHDPRNRQGKVSQAINLGSMQNQLGKPAEALQALEGIDWVKEMSPYGRIQFQAVRLEAYLQLGQTDAVEPVLAWFREHQQEAPATAQSVFVQAGDLDAAAALLVSRLETPGTRADALASLQQFKRPKRKPTERGEYQKRVSEDYRKMLSRPDVTAAVTKYGRIESFPIYGLGH